jgi:hypothetical protein
MSVPLLTTVLTSSRQMRHISPVPGGAPSEFFAALGRRSTLERPGKSRNGALSILPAIVVIDTTDRTGPGTGSMSVIRILIFRSLLAGGTDMTIRLRSRYHRPFRARKALPNRFDGAPTHFASACLWRDVELREFVGLSSRGRWIPNKRKANQVSAAANQERMTTGTRTSELGNVDSLRRLW